MLPSASSLFTATRASADVIYRNPLVLLLLILISSASGSVQAERPLAFYLARRDYTQALAVLMQRISADSSDAAALRDIARVYDRQRLFDSSLVWWQRALSAEQHNDSAVVGLWRAMLSHAGRDSTILAATRARIEADARARYVDSSAQKLSVAFEGFNMAGSPAADTAAMLLMTRFPDSPYGCRLIGEAFYDSLYPVWNNDTARAAVVRRFLERYTKTSWRTTFFQFLLSALTGLGDTTALLQTIHVAVRDDPHDPLRCRYAAALLNRLRLQPPLAESLARAAIVLEPFTVRPASMPAEVWELEFRPLRWSARVALAEALLNQGRSQEARSWLSEALQQFVLDPQQEATPAPIHCLLGETDIANGDTTAAFTHLAVALAWGDSRNLWTARAESTLLRVWRLSPPELYDSLRRQLKYHGSVFTDVTAAAGLAGLRLSRVAWGDYDNDGFDDLLLNGCQLMHNDKGRGFRDISDQVGLAGWQGKGRGGIWADVNNDGWLDFWMAAAAGYDQLWLNHRGHFRPAGPASSVPADTFPTEGAAWADFNLDGKVDLYCANYEAAQGEYCPDRLWLNVGAGHFRDVTVQSGIVPPFGENRAGRGVVWGDFDDDGDPDCFVANYRLGENFLWVNSGRDSFTNRAAELGVAGDETDGWFGHTIGAAWGDFDADGDLDLFTADLAHPRYIHFSNRSRLYENLGPDSIPRFVDRRAALGIRYEETHSDPAWGDVDNDGDLDLYITSVYENRRSLLYENLLSNRNTEPGRSEFRDVAGLAGARVFNGWGCAFSDYDNDGDLDLVVGSGSGLRLLRNDTPYNNHWLKVRVIGRHANRAGIGCRVTVRRKGYLQVREIEGGRGTTSQNSLTQHFGLGSDTDPVEVTVRFRTGRSLTLRNVKPDQLLVVRER